MAQIDRASIATFIKHPNDYVLCQSDDVICAEKKGAWSSLKKFLAVDEYELGRVVAALRKVTHLSREFVKVVNKQIAEHNAHAPIKKQIKPLKHQLGFKPVSMKMSFDRHGKTTDVANEKLTLVRTKEDRGLSTKESLSRVPDAKIANLKQLRVALENNLVVTESQISDSFKHFLLSRIKIEEGESDEKISVLNSLARSFDESLHEIAERVEKNPKAKSNSFASRYMQSAVVKKWQKDVTFKGETKKILTELFKDKTLKKVLQGFFTQLRHAK